MLWIGMGSMHAFFFVAVLETSRLEVEQKNMMLEKSPVKSMTANQIDFFLEKCT